MVARKLKTLVALVLLMGMHQQALEAGPDASTDCHGDFLPPGAVARMGTSRLRHPALATLFFSQDGQKLISAGGFSVRFWDPRTAKNLLTLPTGMAGVTAAALSPDSTTLATGSGEAVQGSDCSIRLWDVKTGKQIRKLAGHSYEVTALLFSPDRKALISGSRDRMIRVWNVTGGQPVHQLDAGSMAYSLALTSDGKTLASAHGQKPIRLWDTDSGRAKGAIDVGAYIYSLAFAGNDKTLAVGGDVLQLLDVAGGNELKSFKTSSRCLAVSADGALLSSGGGDPNFAAALSLWDIVTGNELLKVPGKSGKVAISAKGAMAWENDGAIRLWDLATRRERPQFDGHELPPTALAFAADGKSLVSSDGKTVRLWELSTGRQRARVPMSVQDNGFFTLALAPDGKVLAWSDGLGIHLWDLALAKQQRLLAVKEPANSLVFSADAKVLVSASGGTIQLWDVAKGQERRTFTAPAMVHALALSFDAKWLAVQSGPGASSNDRRPFDFILFDAAAGMEVFRLPGQFHAPAFTPDGKTLLLGGKDGLDLIEIATAKRSHLALPGPQFGPFVVSPDGKTLARGGAEVQLWDIATGKEMKKIDGARGAVSYSANGRLLATGSADTTILVWDLSLPVFGLPIR